MRILCVLLLIPFFTFAQKNDVNSTQRATDLILDSRFQEAIDVVDKELKQSSLNPEATLVLQNKKAEALIRLGKLQDAEALLNVCQTAKGNTAFSQAITNNNIGVLRLNQGRYDLAEDALKKSLAGFESAGKSGELEASQALANLGLVFMSTGQYVQAEEQLQMALTLRLQKLKNSHELIAATYNDLGLVYSQIDQDKGLDYYEKALAIYKQLHGTEHNKIAIANINIGVIYRNLELFGDAVNNFDGALKIWEKTYPKAHPAKAIALYNLGLTYLKMGDRKAAAGYYQRAKTMYEESYGPHHPEVAGVLNAIGNLQLAEGQFDQALSTYQQAIKANVREFNADDVSINPPLRDYYHGTKLLYSLLFKAQAFEARYLGKTLKFTDLKNALGALHACDSLIDILRQQSNNESDKIQLGVIANEVYGDGVRIAYEASENSISKRTYYNQSFYFAEKSKGAVLLDAISDANAKSFAGIPGDLLEEERNLKSAIALTAQKLAQKPPADEERYLRETSFSLKRGYESFILRLEKQFPDYFNLKFNATAPSIGEIQNLLDAKTMLLSYFIDDKNNHLYIFQISHGKFRIVDHVLPAEFDKYITGLRNGLFFNEAKTYALSAQKLYNLLIPQTPARITQVVVLPTGRLGVIPFEALLTKESKTTDYHALPYLLNRFDVRYEFSAGLILQKSKQKNAGTAPSIFLCAPVTFPAKDKLNDLPGTEKEVNDISALFSAKNLTSDSYTEQKADEKLIKSEGLARYSLLHFATHGVVDENNPELSRIFLQSNSEAEDGNLYSGEIYNLQLKADLVTLSACQTGLGKISKGEGVIGLSRALVYAGAKNIIVSFWSVADESTAELMKDFYGNLLGNQKNFSGSLREAKLKLVKNDRFSAPYYWAPFILIGF